MCKAFSCLIERTGEVHWALEVDSHSRLVEKAGLVDLTAEKSALKFARVEIVPTNGDYRRTENGTPRTAANPGEWKLTIDEQAQPTWWSVTHETKCRIAHEKWCEELYSILDTTTDITNPFLVAAKVTEHHKQLLKKWSEVNENTKYSIWYSVRYSVGDSIGDSVGYSVENSVRSSVGDSIWRSVGDSVWGSVAAQTGSLFRLPRSAWLGTDSLPATPEYPFQAAVDLWKNGLVPAFDGEKGEWMLLGSPEGNGQCEELFCL